MLTDIGRLSLSLVSLALEEGSEAKFDDETEEMMPEMSLASYTLDSEVSSLLGPPPSVERVRKTRVQVHRGNSVQALKFNEAGELEDATDPPPPEAQQPEPENEADNYDDDESAAYLRTN